MNLENAKKNYQEAIILQQRKIEEEALRQKLGEEELKALQEKREKLLQKSEQLVLEASSKGERSVGILKIAYTGVDMWGEPKELYLRKAIRDLRLNGLTVKLDYIEGNFQLDEDPCFEIILSGWAE